MRIRAGSYLPSEGSSSETQCIACPDGTLSITAGADRVERCNVCPLGRSITRAQRVCMRVRTSSLAASWQVDAEDDEQGTPECA